MKKILFKTSLFLLCILLFSFNSEAQLTTYNVTGGGTFCSNDAGVSVGLDGSDVGISYQLYNGVTAVGVAVTGTGLALDFGLQTTGGTYSVIADPGAGDETTMTGTVGVTVNTSPVAYSVTGGGNYCANDTAQHIGLDGSDLGVNYQLFNVDPIGSIVAGTGSALDFGQQAGTGTYTIIATDPTSLCTTTMSASTTVNMNAAPVIFNVTGGGSYCSGGSGMDIGLDGSESNVNYQLFNGDPIGSALSGTGSGLDFGSQTVGGAYTIIATNGVTSCSDTMNGNALITINALPTAYNVTGGGEYCSGGSGMDIGLDGSDTNVNYQLINTDAVGAPLAGTGSALDFGLQTDGGTYTVVATDITTACANTMNGNAAITVDPVPNIYNVTGGGSFCAGDVGEDIGLDGSDLAITYQLYNGATAVGSIVPGTGSALDFGLQTDAGTYTVVANPGGLCTATMSGNAAVSINPAPDVFNVTGGGSFCVGDTGAHVFLSSSVVGINYQLYNSEALVGSVIAGTGDVIDFGLQTTSGNYTVTAIDATTSCSVAMSGNASVTANPLPNVYNVTGGGAYCANSGGMPVGLDGSEAGISYQLINSVPEGSPFIGTGSSFNFPNQTDPGTYTVTAVNTFTTCISNMNGSATISINPLPDTFTVTGGGAYCAEDTGVHVFLSSSVTGINYQLFDGSTSKSGMVAGTGSMIDFGAQTANGTYTVVGTDATTSCTNLMGGNSTISINPLPGIFNMSPGDFYCIGGAGVDVNLSGSQAAINYQLYYNDTAVGSPAIGSGSEVDFGAQTRSGSYTVIATNSITGCSNNMSGSSNVDARPTPTIYNMTGGGDYCSGDAGVAVGLNGTDIGVTYQLYDGGTAIGGIVSGTGAPISFGFQTLAGGYAVQAYPMHTCTTVMAGASFVNILPLPTAYSVVGGGSYCTGGTGVHVFLNNSAIGVNYQLLANNIPVGGAVPGTGAAIDFGSQTTVGNYTVTAINGATGCINTMAGSASVAISAPPAPFAVTGGGGYCAGSAGVDLSLSGSEAGTTYQLTLMSVPIGTAVTGTSGTLDFGIQTTAGTYSVLATNVSTGCVATMSGNAVVTINPLPNVYSVTGGGGFCSGGLGVNVGLNGSDVGVNYQLKLGLTSVGGLKAGTGVALDFGKQTTVGSYTIVATNATTGCTDNMTGSTAVSVNTLPTAFSVTGGGGYCVGGTGKHVGLSGSVVGTTYQLLNGLTIVGAASGTSAAIDFGSFTGAGSYTVVATNTSTGCTATMSGSVSITINPAPGVFNVTLPGNSSYCTGGAGVHVGLNGSGSGISYQLFNGTTPGTTMTGSGSLIDFGNQLAGTYTVVATNTSTTCSSNMTGSIMVTANPLPTIYSVTGGGGYCSGATGVHIGLSSSNMGINYSLMTGATTISSMTGSGTTLDFGLQTVAATYSVVATDASTLCSSTMGGTAVVSVNELPKSIYNVTGGGFYCSGGTGVDIGVNNSDAGVNYQLLIGTTPVGAAVAGVNGTALDFGNQTVAGTYTVLATDATTACTNNLTGSASVTINPLPMVFSVSGGGNYCASTAGAHVGLSFSTAGISYQIMNGSGSVGAPIIGSGPSIDFGLLPSGSYTVVATDPTTTCSAAMSGSATVTVNATPALYTVTGGGQYCTGGSGVTVGLNSSSPGYNYQLMLASTPVGAPLGGTGVALNFGLQTIGGTYTVIASSATTGCSATMAGNAIVTVTSLPTTYNVTGGGNYCPGGTGVDVGLSGSSLAINYQLFNGVLPVGTAVAGTGTPISFGSQTASGVYTVIATNGTSSCTNNMPGSVTVGTYTLPGAYNLTGGGNYCPGGTGVHVGLSGSATSISYQLFNGDGPIGSPLAGNGFSLDFGLQTAAGTYYAVATNTSTGCTVNMSGAANVAVSALPTAYNVTGGGSYCFAGAGLHIGLDGSTAGTRYQLFNGFTAVGTLVLGSGSSLDFGAQTTAGTYTIVATNPSTTCDNTMAGGASIAINPLPAVYTVSMGGNYCAGGAGIDIALSASDASISYQLFNGGASVGLPVSGTGLSLDFGNTTTGGIYSIVATDPASGCNNTMSGSSVITVNPLPTMFTVTGGGSYCAGGAGSHVRLSGSNTGVNYQLMNGISAVGLPVAGTGSALDLGAQTAAGTYSAVATNVSTGCSNTMAGTVNVSINSLPAAFTVTSTGSNYCAGGEGIDVALSGSAAGINYQLYKGTTVLGSPVAGTGFEIDFGLQTGAGTYTVVAINPGTTCNSNMTGAATIVINPLPNVYTMVGGGSYCIGGAGVHVGISGSNTGISYQLYNGPLTVGSPVLGTGFALDFGSQTAAGIYTVVATNSGTTCTSNMTGTSSVSINPLPTIYTVTGGGNYCAGAAGVHVGLSGSTAGINYQLYNGVSLIGTFVAGTGIPVDFGFQTGAGTYTVMAMNAATGCSSAMAASAMIATNTLPTAYAVTGGGNYCPGGTGVLVGLGNSTAGINYQLFNGITPVGGSVSGVGTPINFGLKTDAGAYTVVATNTATGCTSNMSGSVSVGFSALPSVFAVTGGGNYCATGAGVHIGISGSATGVNYQLYNGAPTGFPVAGSGGALDFGFQTAAGTYTVVASDGTTTCVNNMAGSASVSITPLVSPSVNLSTGVGDTICAGHPVTVSTLATNGGATPAFSWSINGSPVSATASSFSYMPTDGDVVSVVMTSSAACATPPTIGNSLTLTVMANGNPTINVAATPGQAVCKGTMVTFSNANTFGGTPTFTWFVNSANVSTDPSYTYLPNNGDVVFCVMNSNYRCRLENTVNSNHITMEVDDSLLPVVSIAAYPSTNIAKGQSLTLTASATNAGASPSYQWYVNGIAVPGATGSSLTGSNYNNGDSVTCQVISNGTCSGLNGFNSVRVVVSSEGVQQFSSSGSDIKLVPNPNKGTFTIKGTLGTTDDQEVSVEVSDMLGQVIYKSSVMAHAGDIDERVQLNGSLPNGMYILNLHSASASEVFHVVIEQ